VWAGIGEGFNMKFYVGIRYGERMEVPFYALKFQKVHKSVVVYNNPQQNINLQAAHLDADNNIANEDILSGMTSISGNRVNIPLLKYTDLRGINNISVQRTINPGYLTGRQYNR